MPKRISRRRLVRTTGAGLALAPVAGPVLGALGANERIRAAVAGLRGRGGGHVASFAGMEGVELAYVVDPDTRFFATQIKKAQSVSKGRSKPKAVQDIREVLDDDSVNVLSIATPNHWHALMTIWACQASKDVYVEKPMSHNIHEGRIAVEAARRYKRIVQHGTQNRSNRGWAKVAAVIASGKLGKLHVSRGLCYKAGKDGDTNTRGDIGFRPVEEPPNHLDFNLWQGPARHIAYHRNLVHYRWHWFHATGNGDLGNQGVHQMDVARWMIPGGTLPTSAVTFGGRLGHYDQGEHASTEVAIMEFGDTQLIFETRGLPSKAFHGAGIGNIQHLDAGMIVNQKFYPKGSDKPAPLPDVESSRGPGDGPFGNFMAAVKSRKVSDLNADVLEGHYSAALCHLANMSIRLGNKVPFTPRTTDFDGNEAALDVLERTEAYLAKRGIDLEKSGYTMGRKLRVDAKNEKIIGDPEACALLTRDYRKGFEVPDKIV